MIKSTEMSALAARKLVQNCFVQLLAEQEKIGAYLVRSNDPQSELLEQRVLSQDRIAELNSQLESHRFDGEVSGRVRDLMIRHGFAPAELSEARFIDLADGVARALVEQQRLFQLRMDDRLTQFTPTDPLFSDDVSEAIGWGVVDPKHPKGPSLSEAIDAFLTTHRKVWKVKTYKARATQLGYFVEHVGAARPLASINANDIRGYRDAVLTLRASHGSTLPQGFIARQTENVKARISAKTADLIFRPVKTFFKWAMSAEGLIDDNPAQSVKVVFKEGKAVGRARRPFDRHEIEKLFSCPLFVGCKSKSRRFIPGDKIIRDGKYWLPILGFYTGCRLGELIQLAIGDVCTDDGVSYLDINEKSLAGAEQKSVKSVAGLRKVPLHDDLIEMGFLEFVSKRAKFDKPSVRLFSDMPFGIDGQASTEYSKVFGRLMDQVGLTDPKLVFHSFRHGVEDALRDAGCQPYVIDRIVGHADTTMGGKYGKGVALEVLNAAVSTMKLPISLVSLLADQGGLHD